MPYKNVEDQKKYAKLHYARNKDAYKLRAKAHTAKTRAIVREYISSVLERSRCIDCGEDDPAVLDFDHIKPHTKRFNLGDAVCRGFSLQSVKDEIAKCEIRCANCHRRKTRAERLNPGGRSQPFPP